MLTAQLQQAIGDLVLKVDARGAVVEYVGPRELLNISPDAFKGHDLWHLVPSEVAETARQCFLSVSQEGKARTFEYSLRLPSEQLRYFEGLITKSDQENFLVILRDIQARKVAELKAQESELRFRIMADHAPAMLWMAGIDGECEFFNRGWLDFTGRSLEQELGTGWAEGVHFEDFQNCMSIYLSSFVERKEFRMEYRLRNAKGEYRWLLDQGVPRYAPDGTFTGFIGSCIDITDAKQAEQKLREHSEILTTSLAERDALVAILQKRSRELARSNSELEQFVYAASHDLRAPLRAIHLLSEWIESDLVGVATPEVAEQLQLLRSRVSRMAALLDDLLEYSRVGHDKQIVLAVNTRELLQEIVGMLGPTDFTVELGAELPIVESPVGPLKQVFANLLTNAITHHDRPTGVVRVFANDLGKFYEFSVIDDGPGIPQNFHERVFQMFQTLQPRDRIEGSGVGLALVKKSVESAGGSVLLQSEGRGCTFRFTWPKRWNPPE